MSRNVVGVADGRIYCDDGSVYEAVAKSVDVSGYYEVDPVPGTSRALSWQAEQCRASNRARTTERVA